MIASEMVKLFALQELRLCRCSDNLAWQWGLSRALAAAAWLITDCVTGKVTA